MVVCIKVLRETDTLILQLSSLAVIFATGCDRVTLAP